MLMHRHGSIARLFPFNLSNRRIVAMQSTTVNRPCQHDNAIHCLCQLEHDPTAANHDVAQSLLPAVTPRAVRYGSTYYDNNT